jgi:hypothetical protein
MDTPKKRPNRAQQRAARQLANDKGLTYMQALRQVRESRRGDESKTTSPQTKSDADEAVR